jgi:hypothetical protein
MLVRGLGPALTPFGITNALPNPSLTVYNGAGLVVLSNTDWGVPTVNGVVGDLAAAARQVGAFALTAGSRDAALLVQLDPGSYTAVVSDEGGATGVSLVEVHELP